MTPQPSLHGERGSPRPLVLCEGQPAPHRLLDADTGRAQFIGAELLQVRHLSGPEEDLSFAKLKLILVLGAKQSHTAWHGYW